MLQRLAQSRLEQWHDNPHHRALLIDGARQVGKTYLVRQFAKTHYDTFLEINFVSTPSAMSAFDGDLDADTIIANLSVYANKPLKPGHTLIFLDEIQECPRARTAIKFLVEDGRFDYIESGSMLGVSYKQVPSYPVGYEQQMTMYPLTLREFLWANGIQDSVIHGVKERYDNLSPVPVAIHNRLMKLFRYYMCVGGMPDAVQAFVDTHDLNAVRDIQTGILRLYRQDIAKYADNIMHVQSIFDQIPSQLDKKNKRFVLADISKSARMQRYASDFMWLADAGVALPCRNVTQPVTPLKINEQHNLMKVFLCDIGLLAASSMGAAQQKILTGDLSVNWGGFLENFIAQELTAHGFELYYYDKARIGEIDFLLQLDDGVLPLEAKSGKSYTTHAALNKLMAVEEWNLPKALVLCGDNTSVEHETEQKVIADIPWYMTMFITRSATRQLN
ncbi:AAA family ATPase [Bifidobacterium sp. ESL0763]|uniref:ATP-binding protein n=1 Tax=Bifidobacterium sp. ESL0763 TaxID=2983227 RepID=UPI0023F89E2E|nr:AAA family ATPase [Bifidobacterium sp. ESL0763]MDF7664249.1 AAA family ATPase [Bifidobacterium sp. ESL0763]